MKIDLQRRKPVLGFGMGGLSGPAVKPIAIRCVYDIYAAVDIPIIGTGGINCGDDAIEMMMAGASLVSVGTAAYFRGPAVFGEMAKEMEAWIEDNRISNIEKIVGVANE